MSWRKLLRRPRGAAPSRGRRAWQSLAVDTLAQRRYRADCEYPMTPRCPGTASAGSSTLPRCGASLDSWPRPCSITDSGRAGIKATGTPVPIWEPVRLLGTLAGIALVYGTSMLMWRRFGAPTARCAPRPTSDWTFLLLLETAGLTGFALELALYLPEPPAWGYWMFLFHVAVAMELVLLAPFMKFAHAVYRPLALFFLALAAEPKPASKLAPAKEVSG